MRDRQAVYKTSWKDDARPYDLSDLKIIHDCLTGRVVIDSGKSCVLFSRIVTNWSRPTAYAETEANVSKLNETIKAMGLKLERAYEERCGRIVYSIHELDGQQLHCENSLEVVRFMNKVAKAFGKEPVDWLTMTVERDVLVDENKGDWAKEARWLETQARVENAPA